MAVARISAEKRWLRKAAEALSDAGEKAAARRIDRTIDRKWPYAELDAREVRVLADLMPDDETARAAVANVEAIEADEAERMARLRARQSSWPRESDRSLG